jgi:hypothetical protein
MLNADRYIFEERNIRIKKPKKSGAKERMWWE